MKIKKVYKEQAEENALRAKQAECKHKMWITRCSCCSAVLNCDKLHEHKEYKEIII